MPDAGGTPKSRLLAWVLAAIVVVIIVALIFFGYYRGAGTAVRPSAPLPANTTPGPSGGG